MPRFPNLGEAENVDLKAENVKLKQALEEYESRFIKR